MWKLDESYSKDEKDKICNELRHKLESLIDKVDELLSLHVHINHTDTSEQNCDTILETTFNSLEYLSTYQDYPDHLEVVQYFKSLNLQRSAIDHTF